MAKRPTVNEMMNTVKKRYGNTTGASKGRRPAPKVQIKGRPRGSLKNGITGFKIEVSKDS